MIYIMLIGLCSIMGGGALCTLFRVGEKDGICNYDYKED